MRPAIKADLFAKKSNSTARSGSLIPAEHITRIILSGSLIVNIVLILLLTFSWLALGHAYVLARIGLCITILMYLCVVRFVVYERKPRIGSWMLVTLYGAVGFFILHTWGINAPIGILILGFVIFLANVMLGSKRIIFVTIGLIGILALLQYFNIIGLSQPDLSLLDNDSSYGDVAGYSAIFIIFAVIAWLSGTRTETTLIRAIEAEEALQAERDALAIRVEEQTKRIVEAQQKELKQLYKFAELGQLTTIILHELANYLSILILDIEDLKERHENSIAIEHAKESIFYIDTIIDQVRNQIKESDNAKKFDILATTIETIEQLRKKLVDSNIELFIEEKSANPHIIFGDPLRLSQAITILVTNAAQASRSRRSEISVEFSSTKSKVLISVKDYGAGISNQARGNLFQPQQSTKSSGLGIGLYVTKQIIDTHFKGKIWLSPATEYTQFNLELPKIKK